MDANANQHPEGTAAALCRQTFFRRWGTLTRLIPRGFSKDEWDQLDPISRWLIATRAPVFNMTFVSAALGGILAYRDEKFDMFLWSLCAIGLVLAHASNNLINDWTDSTKGVDKGDYFRLQYGVQPVESKLMSRNDFLTYLGITGTLALGTGLFLAYERGWIVLQLVCAGAFFVLFYTWPLKFIGMGEIAVLLVWGPLMVGGTYYTVAGEWSWDAVVCALPYSLGPTTVIFGKHIDKATMDAEKRVYTLPVLLGEVARYVVLGLMSMEYVITFLMCWYGRFHWIVFLLASYGLKTLWDVHSHFLERRPDKCPPWYRKDVWPLFFVRFAFEHTAKFGMLFLLGVTADTIARRTFWPL